MILFIKNADIKGLRVDFQRQSFVMKKIKLKTYIHK